MTARSRPLGVAWVLAVSVALSTGEVRAAAGRFGVFPVLAKDPATGAMAPVGAAFLIDPDEGLLLTAAHVLLDASGTPDANEFSLRFHASYGPESRGYLFERPFSARLVARGLPSEPIAKVTETGADWAVLQVSDEPDRRRLQAFLAFDLPREQSLSGDAAEPMRGDRRAMVLGFPGGTFELTPTSVTLFPQRAAAGPFWLVNGEVIGGNSGGPCFWDDVDRPRLIGIVNSQLPTDTRQHRILAAASFLPDLARLVPRTSRTASILRYLESQPIVLGDATNPVPFDAYLSMNRLNAIEHWQLRHWICDESSPGVDDTIVRFVCDFFETWPSREFLRGVFVCRPDVLRSVAADTRGLAAGAQEGRGPERSEIAKVQVAIVAADMAARSDEIARSIGRSAASRLVTDAIYVREQYFGSASISSDSASWLQAAQRLDARNPDIYSAAAIAIRDLPPDERLALILDRVAVDSSGVAPASSARASRDVFAFDRVWKPAASSPAGAPAIPLSRVEGLERRKDEILSKAISDERRGRPERPPPR